MGSADIGLDGEVQDLYHKVDRLSWKRGGVAALSSLRSLPRKRLTWQASCAVTINPGEPVDIS